MDLGPITFSAMSPPLNLNLKIGLANDLIMSAKLSIVSGVNLEDRPLLKQKENKIQD